MPYISALNPMPMVPRMVPAAVMNRIEHLTPRIRDMFSPDVKVRLTATEEVGKALAAIGIPQTNTMGNHYHGKHSWGPGYPASLAFFSAANGLSVTGLVDHYSVSGALEFRKASFTHFGIPATVGYEVRSLIRDRLICGGLDLSKTVMNSPGNPGEIYVVFHGFPGNRNSWLALARQDKFKRYESVTAKINDNISSRCAGLSPIDFQSVVALSEEGNITDRHLMDVLFDMVFDHCQGNFDDVVDRITSWWGAITADEQAGLDSAKDDEFSKYMLIAHSMMRGRLLKDGKLGYIAPSEIEAPSLGNLSRIADEEDSILVYPAYKFDIPYLEHLIPMLVRDHGFRSLSLMFDRNTPDERAKILRCAEESVIPAFSGMDVNNWSQTWVNKFSDIPEFIEGALALVGHEISVRAGKLGLFDNTWFPNTPAGLKQRLQHFAFLGSQWKDATAS
ncbi:MAG: hypothetical protein WC527_05630 [Candidatus Margulisiibacteriota bacterium]